MDEQRENTCRVQPGALDAGPGRVHGVARTKQNPTGGRRPQHPYSRRAPHFNRERLAAALALRSIGYLFMGEQLGGRPKEDPLYDQEGRADYRLMTLEPAFREGIQQLAQTTLMHRIVLLCTEKDPLQCHRTLLVAPALEEAGVPVVHILGDSKTITHEELMDRLLRMQDLPRQDRASMTRQQMVEQAVDRQTKRYAYRKR